MLSSVLPSLQAGSTDQLPSGLTGNPAPLTPGYAPGYAPTSAPGYGSTSNAPPAHQLVHPRDRIRTGRQETELCSCSSVCEPNGFMTLRCPCILLAQIYARMGLIEYKAALALLLAQHDHCR